MDAHEESPLHPTLCKRQLCKMSQSMVSRHAAVVCGLLCAARVVVGSTRSSFANAVKFISSRQNHFLTDMPTLG